MPIINTVFKQKTDYNNNQYDYSAYRLSVIHPVQDVFVKNEPSFTSIKTGKNFKNILNFRQIHCIYCGRPLISNKTVEKLKTNGAFSGSIRNFVKEMLPYIDSLHPTEKEAMKRFTIMSFDEPNISLSEAIKKMYKKANTELLQEQLPIFDELGKISEQLPYGWKTKYKKLLQISKYRLEKKEYIPEEFSGKEFSYKIKRVSDTIKDQFLANKILKLTEPLTHPIFKNKKEPLPEKFTQKILTLTENIDNAKNKYSKQDLQLLIINKIQKYAEIIKRNDIINFCNTAEKTINREPVKIKFSNKAFKYDLNEILEEMPDKKLKEKIMLITSKLPTSKTSINAFITKHQLAASDVIGYNLLRPSIVTIEHMKPKSEGGANLISNYALACAEDNNTRASIAMSEFIQQFPIANQKKYFNEIWEEALKDKIPKTDFFKMLNTFFNESGRNINAAELGKK